MLPKLYICYSNWQLNFHCETHEIIVVIFKHYSSSFKLLVEKNNLTLSAHAREGYSSHFVSMF